MKPDQIKDVASILQDDALVGGALTKAAHQTIQQHKKDGRPLAMWRDQKVVWVPAEELEAKSQGS